MKGITIKLTEGQMTWVRGQAAARRCSKAVIVRELIDQQRSGGGSLHDLMEDLCGVLKGSRGLSTRKLKGYGRD
jgi:hypothetical protein